MVLIAGDRDYSYLVSTLRFRQHEVVVIGPSLHLSSPLVANASHFICWESLISASKSSIRQKDDKSTTLRETIVDGGTTLESTNDQSIPLDMAYPILIPELLDQTTHNATEHDLDALTTGLEPTSMPDKIGTDSTTEFPSADIKNLSGSSSILNSHELGTTERVLADVPREPHSWIPPPSAPAPTSIHPSVAFKPLIQALNKRAGAAEKAVALSKTLESKHGDIKWKKYLKQAIASGVVDVTGNGMKKTVMLTSQYRRPPQ